MAPCRLIDTTGAAAQEHELEGAYHMAVDELLLRQAAEDGRTTLRFYRWQPATLSLGYFQSVTDRGQHRASRDCVCVRRASGGGAILHDQELTYAFATPTPDRFGEATHYYDLFHRTLIEVLAEHGVSASLYEGPGQDGPFLCFQRRSPGDVIVAGTKVVGSAQRRFKRGLLQHGSILFARSQWAPELAGLADLAPFDVTVENFLARVAQKLAAALKTTLSPEELTDTEEDQAQQLRARKFNHEDWLNKR